MVPDRVTGRLVPYLGASGQPVEFEAGDQAEANHIARDRKLPPAVTILPDGLLVGPPLRPVRRWFTCRRPSR